MKRTRPEDFPPAVPARSPERQPVQIPPATGYGGYPPTTRDYSYYGAPPVKRHRTSIDFGRQQGIYDPDSRMPYSQPATAIYAGQPGTYQPPMQSYATGQVMPDYSMYSGIPQSGIPQSGIPQSGIPQSGIPQPGLPQSAGLSQMSDPSGQSRSSQQAAVGQMMAMSQQPGTPVRHPSANQ
jgi:hypothetical protein